MKFQRMFDIKRNQIQMIIDRGYKIDSEEKKILEMDLDTFIEYINKKFNELNKPNIKPMLYFQTKFSILSNFNYVKRLNNNKEHMIVYYTGKEVSDKSKSSHDQTQVSVAVVREITDIIKDKQRDNANDIIKVIIITNAPLSQVANEDLRRLNIKYQIFFDYELTYNPTLYIDVPKHELIPPEESEEVLKELKVDISKLPIIKTSDPIVKYYGWQEGDIIRIHRNDDYIGILCPKSINYRVVVNLK
ncbi:MAG: DNA-directed RNA polymerase subunit RpoH/Rpb5 C-terminal domain-containing protein [Candidatus Woesearchaeota archaeon]